MSARKPSILFVNRVYPPHRGASGRILQDLARAFSDNGWDVRVLSSAPQKTKARMDGEIRVTRVFSRIKKKSAFAYINVWIRLCIALLRQPPCDVVVTLSDPPMIIVAGRIFAKFKKAKHIHWCHDLYPDLFTYAGVNLPRPLNTFLKKLSRKSMRRCDKVVVIGRCMAKQLTHSGVDPSRIAVIPNWAEYEILNGASAPSDHTPFLVKFPNNARPTDKQLRDERPKFRILYSGNLGRVHPIQSVIDAAQFLHDHPEIELCFVGDGTNYERLAQERDKRSIQNIRFLPHQPLHKLRNVLETGDIHIVSMKEAASGLLVPCKFYAALSVGRPVIFIGPEDNEIARVIKDFKAGSIVPQNDAAKLVETILDYRNDGDKWFSAQKGALEAAKVFTPSQSIDAWLKRANDVRQELSL